MNAIDLPLHPGQCPRWLFERMVGLAREISRVIVLEYGTAEMIRRLSMPLWFQSLSCVLGFDWHSSGTTTTTTAALKIALRDFDGIAGAGGKGKTGLKTPQEIEEKSERMGLSYARSMELIRASRLTAKVDSSCIQDGYAIYHHAFFFDEKGNFAVIQQGMKGEWARRYHWDTSDNFLEGNESIIGFYEKNVLNMTGKEAREARKASLDALKEGEYLRLPMRHEILREDLSKKEIEFFNKVREFDPKNYEELLLFKGMGEKKIRALALLSNLIYGVELDWKDPIKYSFAHGGKDGIPYPVDKPNYDESIEFLKEAVEKAELGEREKLNAMRRLNWFLGRENGSHFV
ncbi:MAG: DUF763 domain-containing protein [Candidatus Anstonellales archaeon]